jgi:DMSO/TMAO reductase YedYZ molybdopterin-dependent catalytic subunit
MANRRSFLAATAAVPFAGRLFGQSPSVVDTNGLIVRMNEPRNLETPIDGLTPWLTKTDRFYVRSHFAVPKLDPNTFRLTVKGHVEKPLSLSLADLKSEIARPLTLECAGNGRVFLSPAVPGLQWGVGGVGTAEWGGVSLGAILERAKPLGGAADVVLIGADQGPIAGPPSSPGPIVFDRGIPLDKAKRDECLLATEMNGEPLTAAHGAPLRAVIGGWYGMASVKWLTTIIVTDRPYQGFWQTLDYSIWQRSQGLPSMAPLTEMQPKAIVLRPGVGQAVPVGKPVTITGKAWAGMDKVKTVEVSVDAGQTWRPAELGDEQKAYCWRTWRCDWTPTVKGPVGLLARCTDASGRTQPTTRDPDRRSYMINHLIPTDVTVVG